MNTRADVDILPDVFLMDCWCTYRVFLLLIQDTSSLLIGFP